MGTRGTIAVRVDGVEKGAYNHFDSYYSGLGEEMLTFAKTLSNPVERDRYRELSRNWEAITEGRVPTEDEVTRLAEFTDLGVSTGKLTDWYCLLRNAQGDLEKSLRAGFFEPFPVGAEEYSYVIDFDANTFETWCGGEKTGTFPLDNLPENLRELAGVGPEVDYYGGYSNE